MLTDIIISVGMCDNNNSSNSAHLSTLLKTAGALKTRIHYQGIIVNENALNGAQRKNLNRINDMVKQQPSVYYIKPPTKFVTTSDGIHYSADTVEKLFYSMKMHIHK